jgi:hypothetical protein
MSTVLISYNIKLHIFLYLSYSGKIFYLRCVGFPFKTTSFPKRGERYAVSFLDDGLVLISQAAVWTSGQYKTKDL